MEMSRVWAMPNKNTFEVKPIANFVKKYLRGVSIDPFARDSSLATYTNDLNPSTSAKYHLDASDFLDEMIRIGVKADVVILDPPYSPRQVKECYDAIGKSMTTSDGWSAYHRKIWREKITQCISDDGVVLTFGWSTNGMGKKHNFEIVEIMLVSHGSDHNDTICMAERKL